MEDKKSEVANASNEKQKSNNNGAEPRGKKMEVPHFIIAIAVLCLTVLQFQQTCKQSSMAEAQTKMETLMFVREYINGFVYLYDIVTAEKVFPTLKDIRRVGLPAISVPSQYSGKHWLIITHSFGNFTDPAAAKEEILDWRKKLMGWEYEDKSKSEVFKKYKRKLNLPDEKLIFYYKADIISHKNYFESLVRSELFLISPK
jgi:hypothetical protein